MTNSISLGVEFPAACCVSFETIVFDTPSACGGVVHYNLSEILAASVRARDVVRQILAFSRHSELGFQPVCSFRL